MCTAGGPRDGIIRSGFRMTFKYQVNLPNSCSGIEEGVVVSVVMKQEARRSRHGYCLVMLLRVIWKFDLT